MTKVIRKSGIRHRPPHEHTHRAWSGVGPHYSAKASDGENLTWIMLHSYFKVKPMGSASSLHQSHNRCGMLRAWVSQSLANLGFLKTCFAKLPEEGHAFLGTADSAEPVGRLEAFDGLAQNKLRHVSSATRTDDTCQFREKLLTVWIQVKKTVDQSHVHTGVQ